MTDKEASASYATIWNGLTIEFGLRGLEIPFVAQVDSRARISEHGWCTLSQSSFAKLLGVSVPTVVKALRSVEAKGVVERRGLTDSGTLRLRLTPEAQARREHYRRYFDQKREENLRRGR